ncbi:MAG: PD40 domain-containing protein [Candidatus Sericytochromatia bacterium]|nr:PD40 domain-containing protein [Candidatus Sericytochromatia bacterium]
MVVAGNFRAIHPVMPTVAPGASAPSLPPAKPIVTPTTAAPSVVPSVQASARTVIVGPAGPDGPTGGGGGGAIPTGPAATATPPPHVIVVATPVTSLPPVVVPVAPAPGSTIGARILMVSNASGNQEIYSADPTGANPTLVTTDSSNDIFPSFSGDRRLITWCSDRGANIYAIYTAWADGSHVLRLTFGTLANTQPVFSPDGSKIAYVRWTGAGTSVIAVMNRDGTNQVAVTPDGGQAFSPAWSPDGAQLLFGSNHATPGIPVLYRMPAAGGTLTALTQVNGADYPIGKTAWSPDGTRIAFAANIANRGLGITLINADGTNRTELSHNNDTDPVWSPDGTSLLFTTLATGSSQLARMNANGTGVAVLTSGPFTYAQASW